MEWLLLIPVLAAFLVSFLFVLLGLPGNFLLVGLALLYGLGTGFSEITGRVMLMLLGAAVVGELLEFSAASTAHQSPGRLARWRAALREV